jgi:beta-galactosidase
MKKQVWIIFSIFLSVHVFCQERTSAEITMGRERLLMDIGWRFALGHAVDTHGHSPWNSALRVLDHSILKSGKNVYTAIGTPFVKTHQWENLNIDPGVVGVFIPAGTWKRKVFNGLAQIIVQSQQQPGEITLTATSPGLKSSAIKIKTQPVTLRPAVPAK